MNQDIIFKKILAVRNATGQRNFGTIVYGIKFGPKWYNQAKKEEQRLEERGKSKL